MSSPHRPPGHSGNLSDKTIFQNDADSLMSRIWDLKKEKEELEAEINKSQLEIEGWLQILSCSSVTELEQVMDDFTATPTLMPGCSLNTSPTNLRRLTKYSEIAAQLDCFELLDCSKAYKTSEGDLFIKFPWRPPNKPNYECSILLKSEAEHTYSVRSHNFPPTIPTENLAKKYLENPRHGAEGLRKFVAVVGQYTKAMYSRLQQIMALEAAKVLNNTAVNHNNGVTTLNFLVDPRLKAYPTLLVEFMLKFDPMDIMPETVTAKPLCLGHKDKVPPRLQESLDEVAERMKTTSFPQVLLDLDRRGREAAAAASTSSTTAATATPSSTPSASLEEQSQRSPVPSDEDSDEEGTLAPLFDIGE